MISKEVEVLKLNNGPGHVVGTCSCPICERNASLSGGGEEENKHEWEEVDPSGGGGASGGADSALSSGSGEIWKVVVIVGVFGIFGLAWYFWKESKKDQEVRRRVYESGRGNY